MNRTTLWRGAVSGCACFALILVIGCGGAADESATVPDDLPLDEVEIPSQEEADARAAEDITPENADEAFRDLEQEILGDG